MMPKKMIVVVAAVFFFVPPALAGTKGLIGHWSFDEGRGASARDGSGQEHDAKVVGAQWIEGPVAGALSFDGKDGYAAIGDLGVHGCVTIAFWMRARSGKPVRDWQGLVSSDAWEKGVFHVALKGEAVDVYLHLGDSSRGRLTYGPVRSGVWYHMALTADTGAGLLNLYCNGMLEASGRIAPGLTAIKLLGQVVGRENGGRYFRGDVDDVRIYDRALDAGEVRGLCPSAPPPPRDSRNIRTGSIIPDEGYCDQPRVVVGKDGQWICILTTSAGHEGHGSQHVVCTTSADKGKTWSAPVDIEPADGPEASYAVPPITPWGRVYAFYTYNGDRINTLNGKRIRSDTHGWYVYRYSDDNGRTWSERHRLPMRVTACDRNNDWNGKLQMFWAIGKPVTFDGSAMFAFTKLGKYFLSESEGWFYRSDNILMERDPKRIRWQLLPDGDFGVRAPAFGSVQEEHNIVPLRKGGLYCIYRTETGHPCHAYSRDGGHVWTKPVHATYTPGGRKLKQPRACPKVWRTKKGNYLFWYHNNGLKKFRGRNPVWIAGGIEKDGQIHWSQPEILLYDPRPELGMSYPDLIEEDGRYWIAETQKTIARVHEIDPVLIEGLWLQGTVKTAARNGLVLSLSGKELDAKQCRMPVLPRLDDGGGFSIDFRVAFTALSADQVLFDTRTADGKGIVVGTSSDKTIYVDLSDGVRRGRWDCDPGLLKPGRVHHVTIVVDGGPGIITFIVDGVLCDGGESRPFGWGRFPHDLDDVNGSSTLKIAPSFAGRLLCLRVYDRYLRTSEAVANALASE